MSEPSISVVVPTLGRPERLESLLESLRGQTLAAERFEVIVVDDGSPTPIDPRADRGGRALAVRVLRHELPRGPGAARNTGWRAARADRIAFTDDDCRAAPAWLASLVERLDAADGVIVQGRTEPEPDERDRLGPFSQTREIYGPNGVHETCNMAYPKALLERIDGFDESFRYCAEDVDIGWRARKAGARLEFAPEALVYHAVANPGLVSLLRHTWRQLDNTRVVKRHPELRALLVWGVFWRPAHPFLLAMLAGSALAARRRLPLVAAAGTVPYLAHYRGRYPEASMSSFALLLPRHLAADLCELATMVVGSIRNRTLML